MTDRLITSGNVSRDNTRLDLTSDNAFGWLNGVDLSGYQDGNYKLIVYDSALRALSGFIKASTPAGETLGAIEHLINVAWLNGNYWTQAGTSAATFGGGVCTLSGFSGGLIYSTQSIVGRSLSNKCVYCVTTINSITSGTLLFQPGNGLVQKSYSSAGLMSAYMVCPSGLTNSILVFRQSGAVNGVLSAPSVRQLTDPPSTGVHIVSAKGGAVRAWTSEASGFNRNDASGYTYEIYKVNFMIPYHLFFQRVN